LPVWESDVWLLPTARPVAFPPRGRLLDCAPSGSARH
jgi:hypothetical protein